MVQIVSVLAEDYEIDEEYVAKSYGLDALIHIMGEALPEELMDTLQHVQIASLTEKNVVHRQQWQQRQLQRLVKELYPFRFLTVHC